jgi:hypothetical protein
LGGVELFTQVTTLSSVQVILFFFADFLSIIYYLLADRSSLGFVLLICAAREKLYLRSGGVAGGVGVRLYTFEQKKNGEYKKRNLFFFFFFSPYGFLLLFGTGVSQ